MIGENNLESTQSWKTYHSSSFTIQYPANWVVNVLPQGPQGGLYVQQVEFRPSQTSDISFLVSSLVNGEWSSDTLLQHDTLVQQNKVERESKVTVNKLLWSTAIVDIGGPQLAPAKAEIAYANHVHPYRIAFSAPPDQFHGNYETLNAMFHSFQEKQ